MKKSYINESSSLLEELYQNESNKINKKKLSVLILLKTGEAKTYQDISYQTGYSPSTIGKYLTLYRKYGLEELLKIKKSQRNNKVEIITIDGYVALYENLFNTEDSQNLFLELLNNIIWQQENIKRFGQSIPLPRLTAWYGDAGKSYTYSGITMNPLIWTRPLLTIKNKIEKISKDQFNSVLLNQYRHRKDSVSWHSDDEPELGKEPVIASVSFGATRQFMLKHKFKTEIKPITLNLNSGSLLLMKGKTQECWLHQVPKTGKEVSPRINLTFRTILT
ncbi:MAG: alpha-ketoglutarate-dependent dioxygenase AlkB [Snowella sp.]